VIADGTLDGACRVLEAVVTGQMITDLADDLRARAGRRGAVGRCPASDIPPPG